MIDCTCGDYRAMRRAHKPDCPIIKENRRPNAHRIHETKDMFDSDCSQCQIAAKKIRSYWEEQDRLFDL